MATISKYTQEMVDTMAAQAPLNAEKVAGLLALPEFKLVNVRSIIAKAKRSGIEYIAKPAPAKKKAAPSKADMVAAICSATGADNLDGLEKATGAALNKLLSSLA